MDGLAASGASIIAFGCDEVEIPENAFLMIHKPSTVASGDADNFRSIAETLDTIQEGITNTYLKKTLEGVEKEKITEMIDAETWLTGKEASDYFDITVGKKQEILNCAGEYPKNFKKLPKNFKTATKPVVDNIKKIKEIEIALNL